MTSRKKIYSTQPLPPSPPPPLSSIPLGQFLLGPPPFPQFLLGPPFPQFLLGPPPFLNSSWDPPPLPQFLLGPPPSSIPLGPPPPPPFLNSSWAPLPPALPQFPLGRKKLTVSMTFLAYLQTIQSVTLCWKQSSPLH